MANVLVQQKYFNEVVIPAAIEWVKTQEIYTEKEINEFVATLNEPRD